MPSMPQDALSGHVHHGEATSPYPFNEEGPVAEATGPSSKKSGDVLLSQGVSPQVPSALAGLTAVFGMGTGVAPPPWSPETLRSADRVARWDGDTASALERPCAGRPLSVP